MLGAKREARWSIKFHSRLRDEIWRQALYRNNSKTVLRVELKQESKTTCYWSQWQSMFLLLERNFREKRNIECKTTMLTCSKCKGFEYLPDAAIIVKQFLNTKQQWKNIQSIQMCWRKKRRVKLVYLCWLGNQFKVGKWTIEAPKTETERIGEKILKINRISITSQLISSTNDDLWRNIYYSCIFNCISNAKVLKPCRMQPKNN